MDFSSIIIFKYKALNKAFGGIKGELLGIKTETFLV